MQNLDPVLLGALGVCVAAGAQDALLLHYPFDEGAGAVAAAGIAPATGARNSAATNNSPVTMAGMPVRPPAATPAALSI